MNRPPAAVATDTHATIALHGGSVVQRLAALEHAEAAIVLGSGQAAISCTMLSLLRTGDHVVASAWVQDETRRFFERELPNLGIEVVFVDPTETRGWRRVTRRNTRLFFLASPVSTSTRVADLNPPRLLAHELGVALVVDSTEAGPISFRPIEHGADVVIHNAQRWLQAESGSDAGVVCGTDAVVEEVRDKMHVWGHAPDPAAIERLGRDLTTLAIRVQKQCENAGTVAAWAEQRATMRRVWYPGLPSHPDHAIAATSLVHFGNTVLFELADDAQAASLVARLRLFRKSTAAGGVRSAARTLGDARVRLDVGVEDAGDLIADLAQAAE